MSILSADTYTHKTYQNTCSHIHEFTCTHEHTLIAQKQPTHTCTSLTWAPSQAAGAVARTSTLWSSCAVSVCENICMCMCMYPCMYACMCLFKHACICVYICYLYVYICVSYHVEFDSRFLFVFKSNKPLHFVKSVCHFMRGTQGLPRGDTRESVAGCISHDLATYMHSHIDIYIHASVHTYMHACMHTRSAYS